MIIDLIYNKYLRVLSYIQEKRIKFWLKVSMIFTITYTGVICSSITLNSNLIPRLFLKSEGGKRPWDRLALTAIHWSLPHIVNKFKTVYSHICESNF